MIITDVKDLIKLKEFKNKKIENLWCETQQQDIQHLIDLMENVALTAMTCGNNAMGHDQLKQVKQEFVDTLMDLSERYRKISSSELC
jgi:hypothetical protein